MEHETSVLILVQLCKKDTSCSKLEDINLLRYQLKSISSILFRFHVTILKYTSRSYIQFCMENLKMKRKRTTQI